MTYYEDLSPYVYSSSERPMLNIGWLSGEAEFHVGDTPDWLEGELLSRAAKPVNVYRGFHLCEICPTLEEARRQLRLNGVFLGTGEIHVEGHSGILYSAPVMILHYVVEHHYSPPGEFIDALDFERAGSQ